MRGRDEREAGYKSMPGMDAGPAEDEDDMYDVDTGFNDDQQAQVRDNTNIVRGREKEITKVVESIHELSEIFKDLANLVVEQGTMLDRIDYNIEMTATRIEKGFEELEKAEKYQASGTKKRIIFFLILLCVLFFFNVWRLAKQQSHSVESKGNQCKSKSPYNQLSGCEPYCKTSVAAAI